MKHRTLNDEALSYYHKHTAEIEIIRHDRSIEPSKYFSKMKINIHHSIFV